MARALATQPELLLLDEVMCGLNPTEVDTYLKIIRRVRDELGTTVILVEHVMRAVMNVSDRVVVLSNGDRIAEGKPDEIQKAAGRVAKALETKGGEATFHRKE